MTNNTSQSQPLNFKIKIEMLSDWHIGTGAGRTGDIDSLVKRDHNGLPYIPAKTLTGIWRDACELVAEGLDENENNRNWQQWVNYLFGDQPAIAQGIVELEPRHAALSIRTAHFDISLQQALSTQQLEKELTKAKKNKDQVQEDRLKAELTLKKQLQQAITFIKPGIKIDIQSGCAEKDCLRLEEQVRMGSILTSDCTLNLPQTEDEKQAAYALLIAGAAMVERLGGNRRRGSGKCRFTLLDFPNDLQTCIQWIEDHLIPPSLPNFNTEDETKGEILSNQSDEAWVSVPLKIILHSPVIISKRTVGNVVETLDYIPGTHLLRLVARKLGKLGINLIDAITNGDLLVTNATLEIDEQQGKPVPFALFYEKSAGGLDKLDEGGKVFNRLCESETDKEQLKGPREGYISQLKANLQPNYKKVPRTLGTHNTIEDSYQRPTSDVGGVYSYEAIKTGTILRAELRLRQSLADIFKRKKPNWWEDIEGRDRIGQSKKDDYGNIEIKVPIEPQLFKREIDNNDIPDDKLYVWLLSDLLLRDERLRPSVSIEDVAKELTEKLEVEVTFVEENNDNTLTLVSRQNRLDSWQVKWGLPRPSLAGLGAGTCIVFHVDKQPTSNKLAEIEANGIGERTAEGYGQLCFNHPLLTKPFSTFKKQQLIENMTMTENQPIKEKDIAFDYARLIETAAWREAIQRQATEIASQIYKRKEILGITIKNGESYPPMSQLGALRSIISRLQTYNDYTKVESWIDSVLAKPNRKEKWNNGSLEEIRKLVKERKEVWQIIEIPSDLSLTQNAREELQEELWAEAVRTLITTCLLAHKRDLETNKVLESVGG